MGSLPESQITKNKLKSKKQKKHSKNIGKHKTSNRIDKVKDSSSMIPKIKISHKKKDINHTKSISAPDQITTKANEDNTDEDNTEQASCPVLPKKVSKIYFDAYSKLPRQQEVYENEGNRNQHHDNVSSKTNSIIYLLHPLENKQPKDLPTMVRHTPSLNRPRSFAYLKCYFLFI